MPPFHYVKIKSFIFKYAYLNVHMIYIYIIYIFGLGISKTHNLFYSGIHELADLAETEDLCKRSFSLNQVL